MESGTLVMVWWYFVYMIKLCLGIECEIWCKELLVFVGVLGVLRGVVFD